MSTLTNIVDLGYNIIEEISKLDKDSFVIEDEASVNAIKEAMDLVAQGTGLVADVVTMESRVKSVSQKMADLVALMNEAYASLKDDAIGDKYAMEEAMKAFQEAKALLDSLD